MGANDVHVLQEVVASKLQQLSFAPFEDQLQILTVSLSIFS
jgi:hypothetical protein